MRRGFALRKDCSNSTNGDSYRLKHSTVRERRAIYPAADLTIDRETDEILYT